MFEVPRQEFAFRPSTSELEHIRYALDQSAIVAVTDVSGRITYVNDKFCDISKYAREDLLGQDHRILNSGHHPKPFIRDLWRTIAQGGIWRGELRNRAKDGSIYWVDTTIVPFLDERGHPWQYMAIRYDISERKRQEQRLSDQAALTTLGEMAAVLAHEVRNPLAGIRGGVQVIQSLLPATGEARELTRDIVARIDSLNAVVTDLLTYSRLRAARVLPIDLDAFLHDIGTSMRIDPQMSGVTVSVATDPGLVVEADIDQLRIVFTNLLLNAAQAMNGLGRIELHGATEGDRVVLSVADSGPGVPEDLVDRVFQPFFTTKARGTGLGLPTARRIVAAHGGDMTIHNGPTGAVVRIVLPRSAASVSAD